MAIPCYMPQGIYYWLYKHSTRVITHTCMKILACYVNCDDKVAIDSCHSLILDYQKFEDKIFKVDQKALKSLELGALEIFWLYGIIHIFLSVLAVKWAFKHVLGKVYICMYMYKL